MSQIAIMMTNEELAAAINQARDLMSRSGSSSELWFKLRKHFLDLLEIQRARAGAAITNDVENEIEEGKP